MAAAAPPPTSVAGFFTDVQTAIRKHPSLVTDIAGVFQFTIRGCGDYVVDLKTPPGGVRRGVVSSPDTTLEYSSEKDFLALAAGKLNITKAIILQRLKVGGNMKVLQRLFAALEAAKKADEAEAAQRRASLAAAATAERRPSYAEGSEGGPEASPPASVVEGGATYPGTPYRISLGAGASTIGVRLSTPGTTAGAEATPGWQWESDKAVTSCTRCSAAFTFVRRKHHCRACGRIYCAKCSSREVSGRRTCDWCMERLYGVPAPDGLALADRSGVAAGAAPQQQQAAQQPARMRVTVGGVPVGSISGGGASRPGSPNGGAVAPSRSRSSGAGDDSGSLAASLWQRRPSTALPRGSASSEAAAAAAASSSSSSARREDAFAAAVDAAVGGSSSERAAGTELGGPSFDEGDEAASLDDGGAAAQAAGALLDTDLPLPIEGTGPAAGASGDTVVSLDTRLGEVEARLASLASQLQAHAGGLPETQLPSPWSALNNSELAATLFMPLALALLAAGWRVLPAAVATWGLFGLSSPLPALASAGGVGGLLAAVAGWLLSHSARLGAIALAAYTWHNATSTSARAALFRRRMRVFAAAAYAFVDYRITKTLVAREGLDEAEAALVWDAVHRRNAARSFRIIRDLRGLWVKCGQYLSSRPDICPPQYVKVLSALQDAMPARPLAEVRSVIDEELRVAGGAGRTLDALFESIDERALAAASIGQVHRGVLRDGIEVALKVQHRGMDVTLHQDLKNLDIILSWLSRLETGFDIKGVMEEWLKEVGGELDFSRESKNMSIVRANLAATRILATVPRPIPQLSGLPRVLGMRFIRGTKVNDLKELARLGVDRYSLCDRVCRAYAQQIYRDGVFNGDPHPGNCMVVRRSALVSGDAGDPEAARLLRVGARDAAKPAARAAWAAALGGNTSSTAEQPALSSSAASSSSLEDCWVPVLLDFGLTKTLAPGIRRAFARLVIAAEEVDFGGMVEAMDGMNMKFSKESAVEDLENLKYMFRDATPASEARAKHEEREREKEEKEKSRKEKEKKARERKEQQLAAAAAGEQNGAPLAAPAAGAGPKEEPRRVTAWPSDLMFYLRASELLQGLCSHLEVPYPFMHTSAHAARLSLLLDEVPLAARAAFRVAPPTRPLSAVPPLEARLRYRLAQLHKVGAFTGIQVSVLRRRRDAPPPAAPEVLVDVAAGVLGQLDPRPVTTGTAFPVLGVSRLGVAAAALSLTPEGSALCGRGAAPGTLSLDVKVAALWPGFAKVGKGGCTLGELLRGRSGVEGVLPWDMSTDHLTPAKWQEGLQAVAAAPPLVLPALVSPLHHHHHHGSASRRRSSLPAPGWSGSGDDHAPSPAASPAALRSLEPLFHHGSELAPASSSSSSRSTSALAAPLVGPPASADLISHLWFGWGWAVQAAIAGAVKTCTALPGASAGGPEVTAGDYDALARTLEERVLPGLCGGLGATAVAAFGPRPAPAADGAAVAAASAHSSPSTIASLHLGCSELLDAAPAYPFAKEAPPAGQPPALAAAAATPAGVSALLAHPGFSRLNAMRPSRVVGCYGPPGLASASAGTPSAAADACPDAEDPFYLYTWNGGVDGDGDVADSPAARRLLPDPELVDEVAEDTFDDAAPMAAVLGAAQVAEAMGAAGLNELEDLTAGGREHLMDPRILNTGKLQAAVVPSAGLYASATGLAGMALGLAAVARRRAATQHPALVAGASSSSSTPAFVPVTAGGASFSLPALQAAHDGGLRLFRCEAGEDAGASYPAFGTAALGGSFVVCYPGSAPSEDSDIAVAVTVNRLTADRAVPRHVLAVLAAELGLPLPADL